MDPTRTQPENAKSAREAAGIVRSNARRTTCPATHAAASVSVHDPTDSSADVVPGAPRRDAVIPAATSGTATTVERAGTVVAAPGRIAATSAARTGSTKPAWWKWI